MTHRPHTTGRVFTSIFPVFFARGAAALAAAGACGVLAACGGPGGGGGADKPAPAVKESPQEFEPFRNEAATVMGSQPKPQGTEPAQSWSIVIAGARGDDAPLMASDMLQKVQTRGGLPEAYVEQRGNAVVVAYGKYSGPEDPAAKRDLERLRGIEIDGKRPFSGSVLAPPAFESLPGAIPEYNLMGVKRARGRDALYTLQVAIYTRLNTNTTKPEELAEFRKKAEEAVVNLRREGEEAFYYHGPRGSTVTIGVFGPKDADPLRPGQESFALSQLRAKYPFNAVNGAKYMVKSRGQTEAKPQQSLLVPIPE
jgi:hypothetical protein